MFTRGASYSQIAQATGRSYQAVKKKVLRMERGGRVDGSGRWGEAEEAMLRDTLLTAPVLAKRLKRSCSAIKQKRRRLGIKGVVAVRAGRPKPPWSARENAFLIKHRTSPTAWIADQLGRSVDAVHNRRQKMGLRLCDQKSADVVDDYPPPSTAAKRRCLACGRRFKSEWIGNRLCGRCKDRPDYQARIYGGV